MRCEWCGVSSECVRSERGGGVRGEGVKSERWWCER